MKKNFNHWINKLFNMQGYVTYESVTTILSSHFDFKKNFKIINVVGTNGKGSVSQYLNDALIEQGYKVGKFTSPHIEKYSERISVNNKNISDEVFYDIVNPHIKTFKEHNIMWFGITLIAALVHFQKEEVDYVIMEAGVGGLKDPTGFIDGDYGVVTSIGVDHLDYFGSIDRIPYEKAGIMNKGMKFFMPSELKDEEKDVFIKTAKEREATIVEVKNEGSNYQIRNMKLADQVIYHLTKKHIKEFNTPFGRSTVKEINGHKIILDVAHNFDGIKESIAYLSDNDISYDQVLISLSKDKDDEKLNTLFQVPIFIYEHKNKFKHKLLENYKVEGTKIKNLRKFIKDINKDTLFIGSFYLIGDVLNEIKKNGG